MQLGGLRGCGSGIALDGLNAVLSESRAEAKARATTAAVAI